MSGPLRTAESLLVSWPSRHRVRHPCGRNGLICLLCLLAGLSVLAQQCRA